MSTIHIHPTAATPAAIYKLQRQTGLVAVIHGTNAQLIPHSHWLARKSNALPRQQRRTAVPAIQRLSAHHHNHGGDGPSAA